MDYEFRRDLEDRVIVTFSMGHEAMGYWFNEEIQSDLALLDDIEAKARSLQGSETVWRYEGHEYTLSLSGGEVTVRANQLDFSYDELDEGMSYYDEESAAICGLEDFLLAVDAYRRFALGRKKE